MNKLGQLNKTEKGIQKRATEILLLLSEIPRLFREIIPANPYISRVDETNVAIGEALARVGVLLDASRVYVMQDEANGTLLRNTQEWVNADTNRAMSLWPFYDYRQDIPSIRGLFLQRGKISAHVNDLPADLKQTLAMQDVVSVLIFPLWRGREIVGLLGVDTCRFERTWTSEEEHLVQIMSEMVSFALEMRRVHVLALRMEHARKLLDVSLKENTPFEFFSPPARRHFPSDHFPKPEASDERVLEQTEQRIIVETLKRYDGNKAKTAKHLGLSWPALNRRIKKFDLE